MHDSGHHKKVVLSCWPATRHPLTLHSTSADPGVFRNAPAERVTDVRYGLIYDRILKQSFMNVVNISEHGIHRSKK